MSDFLTPYSGHVRVRVGGLLIDAAGTALLLAAHRGLLPDGAPFWSPPGGGWQFGETLHEAVRREFREETGLDVRVGALLHVHEFQNPAAGLQAVELFFGVEAVDATAVPRLGFDPEHTPEAQLLTGLAWLRASDWQALPTAQVHPVIRRAASVGALGQPGSLLA
jgi:8-oxo-dGTP diphosphatase